jgi:hypothetical protein
MRRAPAWPVALALACLAPATSGVEAQEPPAGQEAAVEEKADTLGWHVVREGETLEGITEYYLGAGRLWPENWQLNPDVEDPHLLHPGQRLRVIIERRLPPRSAQVTKIGRRVDDKFHPYDWQKATIGDLLKQQDAVRTHRRSSAELRFDNDTRLLVTEDSVVFLRAVESTVTGVQRESIEILEGQADIETVPTRPGTHEVEILVGEVTAKPKSGATEVGQARARQASGGGAQLMVFKGESEVEAAGAVVSVPKGMGTSVAEGAPPSPPEKLLPAPQVRSPKAGSSWDYANPPFSWQEVAEARSYVVEVCADRDCGKLVERATGLADTSWVPDALEAGDLYWRVTAVSASGLDGFPSKAIAFRINSGRSDTEPPAVAAVLFGAGQVDGGGRLHLGGGGSVALAAQDDAAGVAEVLYRWDGGEWRTWQGEKLEPSDDTDLHLLELQATDRIGRRSGLFAFEVQRDASSPRPPDVVVD